IAYNVEEFEQAVARGLELSPVHEILIEESVIGWKEYELEVMRDRADNFVVICSIENFDPMGIHTGDSVTVAPAQTLTDREYQSMRNDARAIIREVGVETGGSNIQFAVDPRTGRRVVIEMNPRVSRSSALASKATGFPIAKIAALLAVGYRLDEIQNDITRVTPASFEPVLDYVVVKIPRWAFEKFRDASPVLGTQMKSVGEVMAIGRTFKEALHKGLRGLESGSGRSGFGNGTVDETRIKEKLLTPDPDRIFYVKRACELGWPHEEIHRMTGIDPWFLDQIQQIADMKERITPDLPTATLREAKRMGFSDARIAELTGSREEDVRARRKREGIVPVYKRVDTCAAEFVSHTPYLYSTYEQESEADPT
ncbi:MAG TPA: carbamoyl phosphate synthase large subunit, partial [Candidatus Eisenbacteria bacterium]|nr:carbamoyl phosphate synthase large subunit [Candidatus Eisenbacteria bacterium]